MSGGSLNYIGDKLRNEIGGIYDYCPELKAFKLHLHKVAQALHDIEWVQSCDKSKGDELESVRACLTETDITSAHIQNLKQSVNLAQEYLEKLNKEMN